MRTNNDKFLALPKNKGQEKASNDFFVNKAVYTASSVTCFWAGAATSLIAHAMPYLIQSANKCYGHTAVIEVN